MEFEADHSRTAHSAGESDSLLSYNLLRKPIDSGCVASRMVIEARSPSDVAFSDAFRAAYNSSPKRTRGNCPELAPALPQRGAAHRRKHRQAAGATAPSQGRRDSA